MAKADRTRAPKGAATSIEKALDVCEALSQAQQGLSVSELARTLKLPPATTHRLLAVLKRRDYVQQDEQTSRYELTLKMLDLSFRALGRSELRLHAYPALREYVLRTGVRAFMAVPRAGEVTYVWSTGPDAVAMHTTYGREMPGHCALYFDAGSARRLSCLRLERKGGVSGGAAMLSASSGLPAATERSAAGAPATGRGVTDDRAAGSRAAGDRTAAERTSASERVIRFGDAGVVAAGAQRMNCTCAPVYDYTGREVARVGLFAHDDTEQALLGTFHRDAWELARNISLRLGSLAAQSMADTA